MRLGIVVNVMDSEVEGQTTHRLAVEAAKRGHDVWLMSTGNFAYEPDDSVRALARPVLPVPGKPSSRTAGKVRDKWVMVDDFDVLLLRSNPPAQKPWAQYAGINFGRLALRHGVIVLNDPNGLAKAMNKLYFQTFPEEVRPATLITRNRKRLIDFARERGTIVIKPLQGSGGANVFVVRPNDAPNINQMIDTVSRDGYVIAQEYLAAAETGDTRLFLMNGAPLQYQGKYAAFRRVRTGDDMRSNVHAGGKLRRATVDDTMLQLAEMVRPRLVEDGMFLVGLDIVGDKLMEINVFSPGGFGSAQMFEKVNFSEAVVVALERKVQYMKYYRRTFNHMEMATL